MMTNNDDDGVDDDGVGSTHLDLLVPLRCDLAVKVDRCLGVGVRLLLHLLSEKPHHLSMT